MLLHLNMSFFLSAKHWVTINGKKGSLHTHIWEISLKITSETFSRHDLEVGFAEVDTIIKVYLSYFEGQILNHLKPFQNYSPSTENLGILLSQGLKSLLAESGFILEELSIKESPTRGFVLSDIQDYLSAGENDKGIHQRGLLNELPPEFFPHDLNNMVMLQNPEPDVACVKEAPVDAAGGNFAAGEVAAAGMQGEDERQTAAIPSSNNIQGVLTALLGLFLFNLLLYSPVLFTNISYPWGDDAWGHLYKAEFLFRSIQQGDFFPRYLPAWYNGIDPYRYWAPLPYYILSVIRFFAGDIFRTAGIFVFLTGFLSSCGWLLFSKKTGLINAFVLAIIWSAAPDNLRVAFAEGNIPRVTAQIFLPLLIYLTLEILDNYRGQRYKKVALVLVINLAIVSHAMMGALFLVFITSLICFVCIFGNRDFKGLATTILWMMLGVIISSWWLLPAMSGGITAVSKEAVTEAIGYYPLTEALNPLLRLENPDIIYFGLAYFALIPFALYNWRFKTPYQKAAIVVGLLVFVQAITTFKDIFNKFPLRHLLYPRYGITLGVAFLILGCVDLKEIARLVKKKKFAMLAVAAVLAAALAADGFISAKVLIKPRDYPTDLDNLLRSSLSDKGYKVALLDLSKQTSVPTLLIPQKYNRELVYGWSWQGAKTSQNIMLLNSSLEKGWYSYLFDRLIEMGTTDIIVRNDIIEGKPLFQEQAAAFQFVYRESIGELTSYNRESGPYLVTADYSILGIGQFTPNLAMAFPEIELGRYNEVDKYGLEELQKYKAVLLSGFSWVSKNNAESLILEYARKGGRVVVDLSGVPKDVLSNRSSFLGVVAEPVIMGDRPLVTMGESEVRLSTLPAENLPWKTFVLEGVDKVSSLVHYYDQKRPIEGYKVYSNQNIYFVGLNLPYYAFLTKDEFVLKMLSDLLQTQPGKTIDRNLIEFDRLVCDQETISARFVLPPSFSGQSLVLPIAYLDSMNIQVNGSDGFQIDTLHNLIEFRGLGGEYEMTVTNNWPEGTKIGGVVSVMGVMMCLLLLYGRDLSPKVKSLGRRIAVFLLLAPLLIFFFPLTTSAAEDITLDGLFSDWQDRSYIDDPRDDIVNPAGDTKRLYWGFNKGEGQIFFSVVRYEDEKPPNGNQNHKISGKIHFDINDNGDYKDPVDKTGYFQYNPNSGKVRTRLYRNDPHDDSPIWQEEGFWGDSQGNGLQFELFYPFQELGIIINQPIRFYATTTFSKNDNPDSDDDWVLEDEFRDEKLYKHDFDLIPNEGDIQVNPVPVLGYPLLIGVIIIGVTAGAVVIRKRRACRHG